MRNRPSRVPRNAEVADRAIEQAARDRASSLDLSGNRLTSVPVEIGQLSNLQTLDLSENQLTSVPVEIAQLANLQDLDLSNNQLTPVPVELAQLSSLRVLNLSENQLTSLPVEIAQLANLQTLNLGNNLLSSVPIEIAQLANLRTLDLALNKLSSVPVEIGHLSNLQTLMLWSNQLTSVPVEIAQLANLRTLDLSHNQLSSVPVEIAQLSNLQTLHLSDNELTSVPVEIGQLANLQTLFLYNNQLTSVPVEIGQLPNLQTLDLRSNQLTSVPVEIGQLSNLQKLYLSGNQLTSVPVEIGQLSNLQKLDLSDNPGLTSPPPEIAERGTQAILAYLRELSAADRRQWVSKLLLVGEGGVGKTSLLRALLGEGFDARESTTHGIEIRALELPHPEEEDVNMRLNAWDFGGQEIYHATHQFFLSRRSLYLLVWNARQDFEQGNLYYWLDTIQARAPDSPVIIVAAHTDERDARIPLGDIQSKYPQVVGSHTVSNKDGTGIDDLREAIRSVAAGLPLMGESWPASWADASDALRDERRERRYITPERLGDIVSSHGVGKNSAWILTHWLHDLGEVLYFQDDEELRDTVVLDPPWITEYIYKVLENEDVIEGLGIFSRDHMTEAWSDLDSHMRDHFLRLMEQFDLSYRTLENRDISIVVERLSLDPPEGYRQVWDDVESSPVTSNEISMRFDLNTTLPAGIPTWFIARQHRFTTQTHWRYGALFADTPERRHVALIQAFPHDRQVHLSVRGPHPHNFFALLRDGLELTLARFSGLDIERYVPCPGHNGSQCEYQFDYRRLERAIERDPPVLEIECQETFERVSVPGLLFGLHWVAQAGVLDRMNDLEDTIVDTVTRGNETVLAELKDLRALAQREFTNALRREQSQLESDCPAVFALEPQRQGGWRSRIVGEKVDFHLYCEAPAEWHPTVEGGRYTTNVAADWLSTIAPHVRRLVSVLKYTAPVAGPFLGVAVPDFEKMFKNQLGLMNELVKKLPDVEDDTEIGNIGRHDDHGERATGAALREIRQFLNGADPQQAWGGLRRILTPEGHYLWLCDYHATEYRS